MITIRNLKQLCDYVYNDLNVLAHKQLTKYNNYLFLLFLVAPGLSISS